MLAEFAHDLKAPLSSMQSLSSWSYAGYPDLMMSWWVTIWKYWNERGAELQNRILRPCNFSSMDKGRVRISLCSRSATVSEASFLILTRQIVIMITFCISHLGALSCILRMKQLTFALKTCCTMPSFTEMEGTITLTPFTEDTCNAHIVVRIPACELHRMNRWVPPQGVSLGGFPQSTGLGLHITKGIIAEHSLALHLGESDGEHGSALSYPASACLQPAFNLCVKP